ncbi:hypothetical protein V8F20_011233 [Naviculisporaceae sp. PSN 640]
MVQGLESLDRCHKGGVNSSKVTGDETKLGANQGLLLTIVELHVQAQGHRKKIAPGLCPKERLKPQMPRLGPSFLMLLQGAQGPLSADPSCGCERVWINAPSRWKATDVPLSTGFYKTSTNRTLSYRGPWYDMHRAGSSQPVLGSTIVSTDQLPGTFCSSSPKFSIHITYPATSVFSLLHEGPLPRGLWTTIRDLAVPKSGDQGVAETYSPSLGKEAVFNLPGPSR